MKLSDYPHISLIAWNLPPVRPSSPTRQRNIVVPETKTSLALKDTLDQLKVAIKGQLNILKDGIQSYAATIKESFAPFIKPGVIYPLSLVSGLDDIVKCMQKALKDIKDSEDEIKAIKDPKTITAAQKLIDLEREDVKTIYLSVKSFLEQLQTDECQKALLTRSPSIKEVDPMLSKLMKTIQQIASQTLQEESPIESDDEWV